MYLRYSYIWAVERDDTIQHFVDSEPITEEIKEKFEEYDNLVIEIENLPSKHIVGPIEINMGNKFTCLRISVLIV